MRARGARITLKVVPKDRETDVPRDTTVLVTAPRPMACTPGRIRVRTRTGTVDGELDLSSDNRILFWRAKRILDPRAEHEVLITGMQDERGIPFEDVHVRFVTGDFSYLDLRLGAD